MIEIIVTALIAVAAVYIIAKSFKNSSEGKCNGGCSKCASKTKCPGNSDEK